MEDPIACFCLLRWSFFWNLFF